MEEKVYSVSEAVQLTGVPSHVLRYWEEELQITIRRSVQGHRIYSEADLNLFRQVKELKDKGIQLKAIRVLLDETGERDEALAGQIREIAQAGQQTEDSSQEPVYEIVLPEDRPDNLKQFESILKRIMEDVVMEQNEKLERAIAAVIREEVEELYIQYEQAAMREAAAAATERSDQSGGLLHWLRQLHPKKKFS